MTKRLNAVFVPDFAVEKKTKIVIALSTCCMKWGLYPLIRTGESPALIIQLIGNSHSGAAKKRVNKVDIMKFIFWEKLFFQLTVVEIVNKQANSTGQAVSFNRKRVGFAF